MDYKDDIYYKLLQRVLKAYKIGGAVLVLTSFVILSFNFAPNIAYSLDTGAVESDKDVLLQSAVTTPLLREVRETGTNSSNGSGNGNYGTANKMPDKDPSLPTTPTLIIKKIGVNGTIHRGEGEKQLDKGIWMPPDFSSPATGKREPIMLIAHRFGYATWSNEFRKTNSFYNLPKVEPGDEITIIWDQRPFKYKVTEKREVVGNVSTDSDLILYTCKFFRQKTRVVILADRTN